METTSTHVESTRIFISGLPQSLTSEQLAAHFRKQYKISDAHVLPDRRIGFVGFHDHTTAQDAVKYFNRSYIRMSKISVDLAKPVEVKHDANGQAVPVSSRTKNGHRQDVATSTTRTDQQSKKRKRDVKDDGEQQRGQEASENTANSQQELQQSVQDSTSGGTDVVELATGDVVVDNTGSRGPSDSDWLRGKTSRLLDLVGSEENTQADRSLEVPTDNATAQLEAGESVGNLTEPSDDRNGQVVQKVPNGRVFVRNVAFDVTEEDLQTRFRAFGKIQELHVVKDARTSTSKGMAFIQFSETEAAEDALRSMDGVAFHGRLLHVLPASDKRDQGLTEFDISKMPLKKQKAVRRKLEAATATFSWNSLYMNPDAVVSSIANRLGVSKADILDPTSADAAVKQAHAETQVIAETKDYLRSRAVSVDAFKNKSRDDRTILLKNFPFGTSEDELKNLLEPFGPTTRFLMPPTGTMAIAQFAESYAASQALKGLSYKNIKGSVLYLEKAPRGLLREDVPPHSDQTPDDLFVIDTKPTDDSASIASSTTVFVRNLSFDTTSSRLREVFSPMSGFLSARVKTRTDPKRPGEILSNGYGFVEFASPSLADAAIAAMSGYRLDGHNLILKVSQKQNDIAQERRQNDALKKSDANKTKIIIKNLPFQASKKDIRSLFAKYGQLKTVRVPKKFDNSSRGFGFAEFVTAKEAQNAMEALADTHLLGRRLVLDFVAEEVVDAEQEIEAIAKIVEQQSNRINLSKLTGAGRKKFNVGGDVDDLT